MKDKSKTWFSSRQSCLSSKDVTETVPTASRLRKFYLFPYFPVIAAGNLDVGIDKDSDFGGSDPFVQLSLSTL